MKPGKLTDEEFEEMKKHTIYGVDIIKRIEDSTSENEFLLYAEVLAGSHHEKWNGTGYPLGLKGAEIPLQGRLMALVDVYDALTNDRPYKHSFSHEKSVEIIKAERGSHFDPLIVDVFLEHEKEFAETGISKQSFADAGEKLHSTIEVMANAVGSRGATELGNAERMRRYLEILISALHENDSYKKEVSTWDTDLLLMSAQMHDVGKIAIADHILNKTEELTADEYGDIKTHATFGVELIRQIKESVQNGVLLNHAEMLAGCHHEKWDGTGYPYGLRGQGIPLQGRLMAIVDVYNALTNDRPHRDRKTHDEAVYIISDGSETYFDPELVRVFLDNEEEFLKVERERLSC
jgi:HD-GYP domain-containing protein (c-di-GMP phosphodiesterase class II)